MTWFVPTIIVAFVIVCVYVFSHDRKYGPF